MKENRIRSVLRFVSNYFMFFLLVAFVTTSCMMLFVTTFAENMNILLTGENLNTAAKLTFGNVLLLSFLFTVLDTIRRKITVDIPLKKIEEAAEKITQGDFTVKIKPTTGFLSDDTFTKIIGFFNKMAQELQSVETLRTDFIANVSHEMKTPLAVMQNYGSLLKSPNLSDDKRIEYANGVTDGAKRMADMITNILKLNRLENQQIYPNVAEYDLGEQLCENLLQYENIWESSDIEIDTDIAENITIKADNELLALVWNNLFSNAFKFTPPEGKVTVSLKADDEFATVIVSDTGCGMTSDVGKHIFEKFYQGDTSHSSQGNGLGLSLVKKIIDILHGEITVESTVGVGTTFKVKIGRY